MALNLRRLGRAFVQQTTRQIERLTVALEQPQRPARDDWSDRDDRKKTPPRGELTDNPISIWTDWNILKIRQGVTAHMLGNFGPAAMLTEALLGDDRIFAAVTGRTKGTTKCDAVFTPAEEPGGEEVAELLEKLWPELVPEKVLEAILRWSIFLGFALVEKIWEARTFKGKLLWVPRLKVWHPLWIYYDQQRRQYAVMTAEGTVYVEPGDPKWLLFTPWDDYRGWIFGAIRSVSIPWIVRGFALRDWGRFSEKHGLPMLVAKVPAQSSAEDKARFYSSIKNLGADTGIQLPVQAGKDAASWDVQLLEAKDTSWEAFERLIMAADQSITLALRGTNLTTQVDGGSYAAAQTHRDEDSDLAISDRKKLATAFRAGLLRDVVVYNFGSADLVPDLKFVSPESDPAAEAKVLLDVSNAITNLLNAKVPLNVEELSQRFSIPLTEVKKDRASIPLTPSDSAAIVTVNVARETMGLPPMSGEDGALTLEQLRNKPATNDSPEQQAPGAGPAGTEPDRLDPAPDAVPPGPQDP